MAAQNSTSTMLLQLLSDLQDITPQCLSSVPCCSIEQAPDMSIDLQALTAGRVITCRTSPGDPSIVAGVRPVAVLHMFPAGACSSHPQR